MLAQWSKYEDIAMHFNSLIIQTRLQAVGGLAALAAAALVASERITDERARRRALLRVVQVMTIIWTGVAVLDLGYYYDLLNGAVKELLRFEALHPELQLSTSIAATVAHGVYVPWVFHGVVILCLLFVLMLYQRRVWHDERTLTELPAGADAKPG